MSWQELGGCSVFQNLLNPVFRVRSEMLRLACRLLRGQVGEWWASGHEEDLGYSEEAAEDKGCPSSQF